MRACGCVPFTVESSLDASNPIIAQPSALEIFFFVCVSSPALMRGTSLVFLFCFQNMSNVYRCTSNN